MKNQFDRSAMLIGFDGVEKLSKKHVAVFGIGGVGSFCAEALARAGIGELTLVDFDKIDLTNLNRQLIALHSTVGRYKAEVMGERIADINPNAKVIVRKDFFSAETVSDFDLAQFDYIVDAIDTVSCKLVLITEVKKLNVPIISCMGTGNKLGVAPFEITDISKTSVCPLARIMRKELKARGIYSLKVLYSTEPPLTPKFEAADPAPGRHSPGSISFVPSAAGLMIAGEVIKELLK